jgi:hypothetical protein
MNRGHGLRSAGYTLAVAAVAASALTFAIPQLARAYSAQSYVVNLSPDNVVPGPGQPGAYSGYTAVWSDEPGTLCWYSDLSAIHSPIAAAIFQGSAGSSGPFVIELPPIWITWDNCTAVDQSLLDAIAANPGGYYLQIISAAYQDGATRGQLELEVQTTTIDVATWVCPQGTKIDPAGKWRDACGAVVLPAAGLTPNLGMTTSAFGGAYAIDYRVQAEGFDQTIDSATLMSACWCNAATRHCNDGNVPYEWAGVPMSQVTVKPIAAPPGAKLAYVDVSSADWSRGANGSVSIDMSNAWGFTLVTFIYTAPVSTATTIEAAPVVEVGTPDEGTTDVPLTVSYGALVRGGGTVRYDLQVSVDGSPYKMVDVTTVPVSTVKEPAGHTYVFRVRAFDDHGAKSDWVEGEAVTI